MRLSFLSSFWLVTMLLLAISCNYFTYTPRSKKNQYRARPSIMLLSRIADFRMEQHAWPVSKEEFISRDTKYLEAFENFRYTYTNFKIIDSSKMVFYFSGHIDDVARFERTEQVDLNSYGGRAIFTLSKGKVLWKLKMH